MDEERAARLMRELERLEMEDYLIYVRSGQRRFWANLWLGMVRGFGSALGFAVLSALMVFWLQWLIHYNIPLIGDFLAEVVWIVRSRM